MTLFRMTVDKMTLYRMTVDKMTLVGMTIMKNTYCLFQIKFITAYTNVQHVIITQI